MQQVRLALWVWSSRGTEWRGTRNGKERYDSYYQSRWPHYKWNCFRVDESEWCWCWLSCDILFSFEFFTLLVLLLLNSNLTVNCNSDFIFTVHSHWTVLVQNQSSNLKQRAKLIRAKYTLSQFGHFSHFSSFNFCFFSRKWDIIVWYTKSSFPSMTTSYQHHSHPEEWALSRDSTCQGGLETLRAGELGRRSPRTTLVLLILASLPSSPSPQGQCQRQRGASCCGLLRCDHDHQLHRLNVVSWDLYHHLHCQGQPDSEYQDRLWW